MEKSQTPYLPILVSMEEMFPLSPPLRLTMLGLGAGVLVFFWTQAQRIGDIRSKVGARVLGILSLYLTLGWLYLGALWVFDIDLLKDYRALFWSIIGLSIVCVVIFAGCRGWFTLTVANTRPSSPDVHEWLKDQLGKAHKKGERVYQANDRAMAGRWATETHLLIEKALGFGEAELFLSDAGLTFYSSTGEVRNLVSGRLQRLATLIPRIDGIKILRTFQPDLIPESLEEQPLKGEAAKEEPLIFPEQWVSARPGSIYSSIVFLNDSDVPAYDISIETIAFDGWEIVFHEIRRMGPHERGEANLCVGGRNSSNDLGWVLGLWHKEHMVLGPKGPSVEGLAPLRMNVRYRDKHDNWYLSLCELTRTAGFPGDKAVQLRLAEHKPISKPEAASAQTESVKPQASLPVLVNIGPGNVPEMYVQTWPSDNRRLTLFIIGIKNTHDATFRIARNVRAQLEYEHEEDRISIQQSAWIVSGAELVVGFRDCVDSAPNEMQKIILAVQQTIGDRTYRTQTARIENGDLVPAQGLHFGMWRVRGFVETDYGNPISLTASFKISERGDIVALSSPGEGMGA